MDSSQVQECDRKLIDLAKYAASRGGTVTPGRRVVLGSFRYFKRLVMKGEFTVGELTEAVYGRWGDPGYRPGWELDIRDPTPEELLSMPPSEVC